MTLIAALIITLSALSHSLWNIITKRQNYPSKEFFLIANTIGFLCLFPILFGNLDYNELLNKNFFWYGILASLFDALYLIWLGKSYHFGDISLMYPIARSLPVIIVMLVSLYSSKSAELSLAFIVGSLIVIIGSFILPMHHFRDFRLRNYVNLASLFAYLTAIASAGYLIFDAHALHLLSYDLDINTLIWLTVLYSFWRGFGTSLWLALFVFPDKISRQHLKSVDWWSATLAGFGIYFTYTLVLISLNLVSDVSYVATLRQISIPITAFIGIYFLKESKFWPKIIGILLMFGGLIIANIA